MVDSNFPETKFTSQENHPAQTAFHQKFSKLFTDVQTKFTSQEEEKLTQHKMLFIKSFKKSLYFLEVKISLKQIQIIDIHNEKWSDISPFLPLRHLFLLPVFIPLLLEVYISGVVGENKHAGHTFTFSLCV